MRSRSEISPPDFSGVCLSIFVPRGMFANFADELLNMQFSSICNIDIKRLKIFRSTHVEKTYLPRISFFTD